MVSDQLHKKKKLLIGTLENFVGPFVVVCEMQKGTRGVVCVP